MKKYIFALLAFATLAFAQTTKVGGSGVTKVGGSGVTKVSPVPAPATTSTDTFTRANSNPLNSPMSDGVSTWTNGSTPCQITSNLLNATAAFSRAVVSAPTYPNNQSASFTIAPSSAAGWEIGVRCNAAFSVGFEVYIDNATTAHIYDNVAGAQLGADFTGYTFISGDVVRLDVSGSTITFYYNGVSQGTRTSANSPTGGAPAIGVRAVGAQISLFTATSLP